MRPTYLALVTFAVVSTAASARASAARSSVLTLDRTTLPAACRMFADEAVTSKSVEVRLDARISLASCLAEHRMNAIAPSHASIPAYNQAVEPALAILDDVAASGNPRARLVAEATRADILDGMVVRMRNSIPSPNTERPGSISAYQRAHAQLEPALEPWRQQSLQALAEVETLAAQHPDLVRNDDVVARLVREPHASPAGPATASFFRGDFDRAIGAVLRVEGDDRQKVADDEARILLDENKVKAADTVELQAWRDRAVVADQILWKVAHEARYDLDRANRALARDQQALDRAVAMERDLRRERDLARQGG